MIESFESYLTSIREEHERVTTEVNRLTGVIGSMTDELSAARARITELESGSGRVPAILDERFEHGMDWDRYFSDGNPSAPPERFAQTPEGLRVTWIAGSPSGTKRTELGIRAVPGGGETPRRDPVDSKRWYSIEFLIPDAYKLDDATKDEKRLLWQAHQEGGDNPPLSLELRNGTFRLVRSIGGEREHHLNPTGQPVPGIPATKGMWHRLIIHAHWHATAGSLECWFDAHHVPKVTRKTCNAVASGINCKVGSYQPGAASFTAGYKIEHLIRRWAIGNETNHWEDMT